MNKRTKEEEGLFVDEEGSWVEDDKKGIDQGTAEKEKSSVEEGRFVGEEGDWTEGEQPKASDLGERMLEQLEELRGKLPDGSKTAKAIDEGAPWMEIAQLAEGENCHEIANLLFEAEQQGLDD
uniref:Uncharacterized protein n=1 Tax=Candidatus Kentrum sp. DK TaxID=2126562 RepID=A0A450SP77_9GAMM|nr:MAG: hypothetical protein BECKDK2373B_GA0170837_105411 [Candidatus Kentron sp. DK]